MEWLAAMCSHVPNKGEQMVRYYGYYSNVSRGKRKRNDQDKRIPAILKPVEDPDFSGRGLPVNTGRTGRVSSRKFTL